MSDREELAAAWQIGVDAMAARMTTVLMIISMRGGRAANDYVNALPPIKNPFKS